MEDAQIVELYLARDDAALKHSAEKYGARLRNLANTITEDLSAAEECENDTYFEAWNSIPPHEPRTYLFAFLARITRHLAIDRCRARSRAKRGAVLTELTVELQECVPGTEDVERALDAKELAAAVSAFLRTLPEEKRNVFLRRYWYGDAVSSIADRFSLSVSKVKTQLYRTRNELRTYLEKEGYPL